MGNAYICASPDSNKEATFDPFMRILQICSKIPFPPKDGGSVAMNILTQGLIAAGNQVDVLAVNTPKHFMDTDAIDPEYRKMTNYRSVFIDTSVKPLPAFLNLFSSSSYNVIRFYSPEFRKELIRILKENNYDVIQLETLWVAPYLDTIREHSKAKVVLRSQNIEYSIWERLAAASGNPIKRRYLHLLAKRLKKFELSVQNRFDAILPITQVDLKGYQRDGCSIPLYHVPFGIDLEKYKPDRSVIDFPSVFHLGAMDWRPNADGIKWILEEVWPSIHAAFPMLKFYLAGRNMPEWMLQLRQPGVLVEGEVPDAQAFLNSKGIMVVPLSSGGGMRVKIIEGMALGKTIISTTIGAEGIDYTEGKDILIADTKEHFLNALTTLLNDRARFDVIGKNAQALVAERYDNARICKELTQFYNQLLHS